jgi:hypothetical protein
MTTPRRDKPPSPEPVIPPDEGEPTRKIRKDPPPRGGDRPGDAPVEIPPRDPSLRREIGPEDEDRRRGSDERPLRGVSP